MVRFLSASIKAGSSTTEPRAMLMRIPFGPSALSTSALIMFCVAAPPGTITTSVSTSRAVWWCTRVKPPRPAEGGEPLGDCLADAAHADHADAAVAQRRLGER